MEIQGRIKLIEETKIFGANGFRNRILVLTTDEQYPQHIEIKFTQDKCDILNNYRVGQPVKIGVNLRGREWVNPQGETKYFNSIEGWKIESQAQQQPPQGYQQPQQQYGQPPAQNGYPSNSAVNNYQNNQQPQQVYAQQGQPFQPAPPYNEKEHDDLPF